MADETTKFPDSVGYSDDKIMGSSSYSDNAKILNSLDESDSTDGGSKFPLSLDYGDGDYLAHDRYKDVAKIIDTLEVPHKNIKGYAFCA